MKPPLKPTRTCETIPAVLPNGDESEYLGPPIPAIEAERADGHVLVRYRFLAAPEECEPKLIQAQVVPLSDSRYAASVKRAQVRALQGVIKVRAPRPGPPYSANLLTYGPQGPGSTPEVRVR